MKKLIALLAVLACSPAAADVTVGYASSGTGYRGFGAYEGKGVRSVSGLKSRDEGNGRFTGALLGLFSGKKGKDSVHILRVDLDKDWELDPGNRIYRERPITPRPPSKGKEERSEKSESKKKEEKPTHRIKSAKADVRSTGETKEINGFKASRHIASLIVELEEIATKDVTTYKMSSDIWTTPWTQTLRDAQAEDLKFQQAYLKKLGLDVAPGDAQRFGLETAARMLAAAGPELEKAFTKLAHDLGKIDGYAVLTQTAWYSASSATAKAKKAKAKESEEGSALSDAAGAGSIGGAAAGMLGGFAKRAASRKAQQAMTPDESKPAFSVRTEITKVQTSKVAPDAFEVPKDYKKKS